MCAQDYPLVVLSEPYTLPCNLKHGQLQTSALTSILFLFLLPDFYGLFRDIYRSDHQMMPILITLFLSLMI